MRETFVEKEFGLAARQLLSKILAILQKYSEQGYDLSLRQLYYQLVAANEVENTERSYKNIGNLVSDARLAGLIDWNMIDDRGRTTSSNSHWQNPRQFIDSVAPQFAFDKWENQDTYVEVMVEKQALEGVLEPLCSELDIPFSANKGYSSSSALYKAGKRFRRKLQDLKECHVIYLGDHDPSGMDMTRDVGARINLFAGAISDERLKRMLAREEDINTLIECGDIVGVMVHRVALNMDQIKTLRPPKNPAKMTDSRADEYVRLFGTSSWELDAIEPRALAKLVRDKVYELRDAETWEKDVKRETAMRDELIALAKKSKFK